MKLALITDLKTDNHLVYSDGIYMTLTLYAIGFGAAFLVISLPLFASK